MARDSASFGKATTTGDVLEGIDLRGKVAMVTGASGGLGAEAARALAAHGARVVVTARDRNKVAEVAARIRSASGADAVETMDLELTSARSVRECAAAFLQSHERLDILINNAGVMACPLQRSEQGFESQFATNHLGHFLLTCLLVPALRRAAPARVVSVSSAGHRFSPVVFDDIHFAERPYDKWLAYGQAKTANVLLAVELDRRLRAAGVRAYAIHPGIILTDLARHLSAEDLRALSSRSPGGKMEFKDVEAGAATEVFAATAPELEGRGALYLEDCQVAAVTEDPMVSRGVRGYAVDAANAARLWEMSETMLGERFPLD